METKLTNGSGSARNLSQDIHDILSLSKTESCSVLLMRIGAEKEEAYKTYRAQATGELQPLDDDDGTLVYQIGSLTKFLVAMALHLIMDIYRTSGKPEHKKYRRLQNWNQKFVDALNGCSPPEVMEPLPGDPTLQQMLVHFKGLPIVNRFMLAPDGTPLMSAQDFIKIAPYLSKSAARETGDSTWLEYSNGNYILIGILIEAVSEMSLGNFLRTEILEPLEMDRTYVSTEKLRELEASSRVIPYVVSGDGRRERVEDRVFMSNTMEIAALGIYSCTRDLGRLYEALLPCSADQPSYKILDEKSIARFFGYDSSGRRPHMSVLDDQNWVAAGLVTTTNSLRVGCRSVNRLVLSDDKASSFALGTGPKGSDFETCYQAGSISTFSCYSYMVMETNEVVIVLSNTLGQGDAADYVTRRILQDRDDLKVHNLPLLRRLRSPHGRVDVIEKAKRGSQKFFKRWRQSWAIHDTFDDSTLIETGKLVGLYKGEHIPQSLSITANNDGLSVEIVGTIRWSRKMRLARIGRGKLKICPEVPGIDTFDAWKDLELHYESGGNEERVFRLSSTTTLGQEQCKIIYILQSET